MLDSEPAAHVRGQGFELVIAKALHERLERVDLIEHRARDDGVAFQTLGPNEAEGADDAFVRGAEELAKEADDAFGDGGEAVREAFPDANV